MATLVASTANSSHHDNDHDDDDEATTTSTSMSPSSQQQRRQDVGEADSNGPTRGTTAASTTTTTRNDAAAAASAVAISTTPDQQTRRQNSATTTTPNRHCRLPLFSCQCESPKSLTILLQSLLQPPSGKNAMISQLNQPMTVYASSSQGMTIHAFPNKQFQASMELSKTMFGKFQVTPRQHENDDESAQVDFCIPWKTLMDCLQVLTLWDTSTTTSSSGQGSTLTMAYNDADELFQLESDNHKGVVSTAAIPGLLPPDHSSAEISTAFGQYPVQARLLLSSKCLLDLCELEHVASVEKITILVQRQQQEEHTASTTNAKQWIWKFEVKGHAGKCTIVITNDDTNDDIVWTQQDAPCRFSFPFGAWCQALKPLDLATETCISINTQGILAIQHQILPFLEKGGATDDAATAFCDYLLLPLEEEDDDDDPDTATQTTYSNYYNAATNTGNDSDGQSTLPSVASHRRRQQPRRSQAAMTASVASQGQASSTMPDEASVEIARGGRRRRSSGASSVSAVSRGQSPLTMEEGNDRGSQRPRKRNSAISTASKSQESSTQQDSHPYHPNAQELQQPSSMSQQAQAQLSNDNDDDEDTDDGSDQSKKSATKKTFSQAFSLKQVAHSPERLASLAAASQRHSTTPPRKRSSKRKTTDASQASNTTQSSSSYSQSNKPGRQLFSLASQQEHYDEQKQLKPRPVLFGGSANDEAGEKAKMADPKNQKTNDESTTENSWSTPPSLKQQQSRRGRRSSSLENSKRQRRSYDNNNKSNDSSSSDDDDDDEEENQSVNLLSPESVNLLSPETPAPAPVELSDQPRRRRRRSSQERPTAVSAASRPLHQDAHLSEEQLNRQNTEPDRCSSPEIVWDH